MKSKLKVKPLHDRIIVKPHGAEEKTSGGIIIPDTVKERPNSGIAVAVGDGRKDEPMTISVGDTLLYGKHVGTEIEIGGNMYLIMRESDVLAVT